MILGQQHQPEQAGPSSLALAVPPHLHRVVAVIHQHGQLSVGTVGEVVKRLPGHQADRLDVKPLPVEDVQLLLPRRRHLVLRGPSVPHARHGGAGPVGSHGSDANVVEVRDEERPVGGHRQGGGGV